MLNKKAITFLHDVFMQSQTKEEKFIVLKKCHQMLLQENMKAAPDKSHRVHIKDKYTRMKNTALTFFQRKKQTTTVFL